MKKSMGDVGLGILCWKGYDSLRCMLDSYEEKGFFKLFNEKVIYFQEIDDEARKIAEKYKLEIFGNNKNTGIYGGFCGLVEHMKSSTILFVENDQTLVVSVEEAQKQISIGRDLLKQNKAHLIQFQSRKHRSKIAPRVGKRLFRFHPPKNAPLKDKIGGWIKQTFRPTETAQFAGQATQLMDKPQDIFKDLKYDEKTKFFLMSTNSRQWVTQNFLVEKDFFVNTILSHVEKLDNLPEEFLANGFKTVERGLLYKKWWRKQPFVIAMAEGIFIHDRKEYRGY